MLDKKSPYDLNTYESSVMQIGKKNQKKNKPIKFEIIGNKSKQEEVIVIKIKDIQSLHENERVHFWRSVNSWNLKLHYRTIESEKL